MALPESRTLNLIFKYIDDHVHNYIGLLKEAVSIKSVSCSPHLRDDCITMVKWLHCKLKALGVEAEECDVGTQTLPDGKPLRLPPVILGSLGKDPSKPTVCIYGHLDVQPATLKDGWMTDPFILTEIDGKFYGRGASDNKGPVLCWLNAIQAYQKLELPIPVNLKFVFEAMEECGSDGLEALLNKKKGSFFHDVDYVCISDNHWQEKDKPCLTYGFRGLCYFYLEIICGNEDLLNDGVLGENINEAMADLICLLSTLVDKDGTILIPNINNDALPVTDGGHQNQECDFSVLDYKKGLGLPSLSHKEDKTKSLMSHWRSLSINTHGIEECFNPKIKAAIPRKLIGKFSIRILPNQDPKDIEKAVIDYLTKEWNKRSSRNKFKVSMVHGAKAWVTDPQNSNYEAAIRATKRVYDTAPDMTFEGGSIPITLTFQNIINKNLIMIPIGACDDGAHSVNEKLDRRNYIQGTKLLAAYLYEIGKQRKK